jgi:hypothetical protein
MQAEKFQKAFMINVMREKWNKVFKTGIKNIQQILFLIQQLLPMPLSAVLRDERKFALCWCFC